ncbi:MAG: glycosyltransferase family 2 protein [Ferruginibacter sp.]|nr:glycosyltransferase family 2 protein [Ferruginibacter sp.]
MNRLKNYPTGFSILICTFNGAFRLKKTISVLQQLLTERFPAEIIVVDNNSTDETYSIAVHLQRKHHAIPIKVIRENQPGKTHAMITGIAAAQFSFVVICDDDNWLRSDYLLNAYQIMEKDSNIALLGGMGIPHVEDLLPEWFATYQNAFAVGGQQHLNGDADRVWGAGMVIRKHAWDQLFQLGFAGFLTGRKTEQVTMAGEDSELSLLIKALGHKIIYSDKLVYEHDLPASRLTWQSLNQLWEGFARSSIYFDMYQYYFEQKQELDKHKIKAWYDNAVKKAMGAFLPAGAPVQLSKILSLTFIINREGYEAGLDKRRQLFRLKELLRIRKTYQSIFQQISEFRVA